MNIVYIASEAVPFSKTGGLADVIGVLPKTIKEKTFFNKVSVFIPYYSQKIDETRYKTELIPEVFYVQVGAFRQGFCVRKFIKDDIDFYFIQNEYYFGRPEIYGPSNEGYSDNGERFMFFSQACLIAMKSLKIKVNVLHLNDWQTGLVPVYIKKNYFFREYFNKFKTKTVFTIHNIDYQGIFDKSIMNISNISWNEFVLEKLEFFDKVNFLKAGIVYSDFITTVSKRYAKEIQEKAWISQGLETILKKESAKLYGIVNGLDIKEWNPRKDKFIFKNYCSFNVKRGKEKCKKNLQEILKLPVNAESPIIAIISRLVKNKGFDIIEYGLEEILDRNSDLQLVLIGRGETKYENYFKFIADKYKKRVSINIMFANGLSHKIYAGADMFLMPSTSEACGLGQLISFRYGTIPIVNPVGGLYDTVKSYHKDYAEGTGFTMREFSHNGLIETVNEAINLYKNDKKEWTKLMKRVMKLNLSWDVPIKEYLKIYKMKDY
jgi:starch synthase